jgi:DHA2 family methylenomycin A resistance protein-like MFS transporter
MTTTTPSRISSPTSRRTVLVLMCVGMFLVQLDVTVVMVALPSMGADLRTGVSGLQWVVDGYAVALSALLLLGGAAGDRFGHKRVVVVGLVLFGLASAACGASTGGGALVAARAVQGVGAALLLPGTLAVISRAVPDPAEHARAVGVWAGVSALALPTGPVVGGFLVSTFGWRAVFLVNLPIIAVALPMVLRWVRAEPPRPERRLDAPGAVTAVLALAALVHAIVQFGHTTGISVEALLSAGVAVVMGSLFVVAEKRSANPLVPLSLLRRPDFVGVNGVAAIMNFVGIGTVFVTPLYLQTVLHVSPFLAGLDMLPLFVPLSGLAPLAGRITGRFGPRVPMGCGLALGVSGNLGLLLVTSDGGYARWIPALLGLGVGMGLLTASVVAAAVRSVPGDRSGLASGVNNTARQAAGALGIAVYGAIAGSATSSAAFTARLHVIGLLGASLWAVGIVIAWATIPRRTTA